MEIEELMNYMLALFDNTDKDLQSARDKLSYKDKQLDDLDHYIEINKLNASQYAKVGKLRKTLREERRQIKNDIDIIVVVKRFTDKYNNKMITGDIINNLKEQKKLKEIQDNPTYKYKTDILNNFIKREDTNE